MNPITLKTAWRVWCELVDRPSEGVADELPEWRSNWREQVPLSITLFVLAWPENPQPVVFNSTMAAPIVTSTIDGARALTAQGAP